MPSTFAPAEREAIDRALRSEALRLFTAVGLKKTSLDDLARAAGIAKSTFYAFYPSKEALYLDLLAQEGPGVKERVLAALDSTADIPVALERFLRAVVRELETNALTKRMLTHPEELALIARKAASAGLESRYQRAQLPIQEAITRLQATGQLISADPEVIYGQIQAVTLLLLHQDTLGPRFRDILHLNIQLVAHGLSAPK